MKKTDNQKNHGVRVQQNWPRERLTALTTAFVKAAESTQRTVKYNQRYMDTRAYYERREVNYMNVITHPRLRVALKPGQLAVMRTIPANQNYKHLSNLLLMIGTLYGTVVLFGQANQYHKVDNEDLITGPTPRMHATGNFWGMVRRHRNNGSFAIDEAEVAEWVLSENFRKDIGEYFQRDKADGHPIGDGLPPKLPRENSQKPQQAKAEAVPAGPAVASLLSGASTAIASVTEASAEVVEATQSEMAKVLAEGGFTLGEERKLPQVDAVDQPIVTEERGLLASTLKERGGVDTETATN